jgi:hypothetical protein
VSLEEEDDEDDDDVQLFSSQLGSLLVESVSSSVVLESIAVSLDVLVSLAGVVDVSHPHVVLQHGPA